MRISVIAVLVIALACSSAFAGDESLASSATTMKPGQTLPAKFKCSKDIVHEVELFAPGGNHSLWTHEFHFGMTLHLLVISFDAAPLEMSREIPVEYTYYHDGTNWCFHSTSRVIVSAVSPDPKKQTFSFMDRNGQQFKVISYKDVYKEQIKKLFEAEGKNSNK